MTESDRISVEYRTTTGQDILVLTLDVIGPARKYFVWKSDVGPGVVLEIANTDVILIIDGHLFKLVCRAQYQPLYEA